MMALGASAEEPEAEGALRHSQALQGHLVECLRVKI